MTTYNLGVNFAPSSVQPTFNRCDLVWTQVASAADYLLGGIPLVASSLRACGFGLGVFFDKDIHDPLTPNDYALRQTVDGPSGRVVSVSTTPSTTMWAWEDAAVTADLLMSAQLGGTPPGLHPDHSGKPAEHPYPTSMAKAGAFVRAWRDPSQHHRSMQWIALNEGFHAEADISRYNAINGDPAWPLEESWQFQGRRSQHKQRALEKISHKHREWFPATGNYGEWDTIVTGSWLQSDTHFDAAQKLLPNRSNAITAWLAEYKRLVATGQLRAADFIGFTSYNGKFALNGANLGSLTFTRSILVAGDPLFRLVQYAPGTIRTGTDEDDEGNPGGPANKMTAACEMLLDLEWLAAQPDVAIVGLSYPISGAKHALINTSDGVTYTLNNRGTALQLRAYCPPRRAAVSGATAITGSPANNKVYAFAGWSSARAVLVMVNNGTSTTHTAALTLSNLPTTITGRSYTRTLYTLTEAATTPAVTTWDGSSNISLPPESITVLVLQVTGAPDVTARLQALADGTFTPVCQRVEPFNGRPGTDYGWLDHQRGVAMLYASGSLSRVSCAGVWTNLPDVIYATLFLWNNAGSGVYVGVDVEVPGKGILQAVSRLAGAVVNGEVQTINLASLFGARWPTVSRTARVRVWLAGAGAGMSAEVWLSGTSAAAAAVNG